MILILIIISISISFAPWAPNYAESFVVCQATRSLWGGSEFWAWAWDPSAWI